MHMLEQRLGRKPLRDVLRSVACPVAAVEEATSSVGGGKEKGMDIDDGITTAKDTMGGATGTSSLSAAAVPENVRPQALRTLSFLRLCLKTSTKGDFVKNLRESWLEGRGPAYFQVSYTYDRRVTKVRQLYVYQLHVIK